MAASAQAKGAAKDAAASGKAAVQNADSEWVQRLGQVGVAGIGVVYVLVAWLALQVAFGGGSGQSADNTGALNELAGNTAGKILLGVLVVGFAFYALWQIIEAIVGFHRYDEKKRTKKRVMAVVKGLIGASLAVTSVRVLTSGQQESSSSKQADMTAKLMEQPFGRWLVGLIGLALIAWSVALVVRGIKRKFLEKLERHPGQRVEQLGVAGYVARGVAFGVLGILIVVAGVQSDPEEASGLDAALKTLAEQPFGTALLCLVALGLLAFGIYELITARIAREG